MSFPPYGSYEDSSVDWIGQVPTAWQVVPLKAAVSVVGGATPKSDVADYWDGGVPWITPGDLSRLETPFIGDTIRTISEAGLASCAATRVPAGSVILSTRAPIGSLGITTEPATTNQGCKALVPRHDTNARFLAYTLSTATTALNVRGKGTTFLELSGDELARFKVPLPSAAEQSAIAAFLDRETAKIDALVEAQRLLIELLKEKRQAVISHAVTKGLDPNVPMKNSGIEWLGEVPAHWNTLPLRAVANEAETVFIDGDWIESKDIAEEGIRYITTGNVGEGVYREQGSGFISEETFRALRCTEVLAGDVLISRLNVPIGRACLVPNLGVRIVTSVDNVIVRANRGVERRYLVYLLSAKSYFAHMETLARGTTMQRVSRTTLGNVRICLPPVDDQKQIADYIEREVAGLHELARTAEGAVELLKERRAALISAAVTGKIDVRGLVCDHAEAA